MNTAHAVDPIEELVATVRQYGREVGTEHQQKQRAYAQKVTAEGALLAAVLEEIADALLALVGPITVSVANNTHRMRILGDGTMLAVTFVPDDPADKRPIEDQESIVTAEWAAAKFGLQKILHALLDSLETQIARQEDRRSPLVKAAEKFERHAELVSALTVVLKKGH